MEVGAVKQAYNNEVILLKKCLNQARIQIIHKLTRKAKTFSEKKAPEKLKEKLKRKAESAVNEVLIMKKIKPKEIAKFIVTHKGQLKDYLNKPKVDKEKVCARLLLHKSLQDKYKFIRERFSNVRIEDLLMSRQERLKLKKEAKEHEKQKKAKNKNKVVNSEGEWHVENIEIDVDDKQCKGNLSGDEQSLEDDQEFSHDNDNASDESDDKSEKEYSSNRVKIVEKNESESDREDDLKDTMTEDNEESSNDSENGEKNDFGALVKITPSKANITSSVSNDKVKKKMPIVKHTDIIKKVEKKSKDNKKNKSYNEKILIRKFKKDNDDIIGIETKVVDPFFITATGDNYMSLAEPRQPDEVKEIHKQGNRKLRRAAMFGHAPKIKPKQEYFRPQNNSNREIDNEQKSKFNNKWSKDSNYQTSNFNKRNNNLEDKSSNFNDTKSKFSKNEIDTSEKLHPSWEAKKKQSGILPFQGKKIVFDDS